MNCAYGGDPRDGTNLVPRKKILALLNPFGGRGLAPAKWETAKEIFNKSHVDVEMR